MDALRYRVSKFDSLNSQNVIGVSHHPEMRRGSDLEVANVSYISQHHSVAGNQGLDRDYSFVNNLNHD